MRLGDDSGASINRMFPGDGKICRGAHGSEAGDKGAVGAVVAVRSVLASGRRPALLRPVGSLLARLLIKELAQRQCGFGVEEAVVAVIAFAAVLVSFFCGDLDDSKVRPEEEEAKDADASPKLFVGRIGLRLWACPFPLSFLMGVLGANLLDTSSDLS